MSRASSVDLTNAKVGAYKKGYLQALRDVEQHLTAFRETEYKASDLGWYIYDEALETVRGLRQ